MTTIGEPHIDVRPEQPYLGIRTRTPMKGMFTVVDRLRKELVTWFSQQRLTPVGPVFLRYHVIDMARDMDIEVGLPVATVLPGDDRVRAGSLPAGSYACVVYMGNGLTGNKALLSWIAANGLVIDRWADPQGDAFAARAERFLTEPQHEPRKTKWAIEVAIKLREQ